jgi:uncharacterized protein (DUF4415 family)
VEDTRQDYGEQRIICYGYLAARLVSSSMRRELSSNPRQLVSLRLPADVLARWKASGSGW